MHPTLRLLLCGCLCLAAPFALAQHAKLPIKLVDKLILIEGKVEGHKGYFILDLGVSDIVLNNRYFQGVKDKDRAVFGIHGVNSKVETTRADVDFGGIPWKRRLAHILSLRHLEETKGEKLLGLVGGRFFHQYQLLIDLSKMEVEIAKYPISDHSTWLDMAAVEPDAIIPFKYKGGMPWVEVRIASVLYRFGLDTASEFTLMDKKWYPFVKDILFNQRTVLARGITATTKRVTRGKLGYLEVGNLSCYPMSTLFTNMGNINRNLAGAKLDGLLGFDFLRQFKVLVDYRRKDILVWRHAVAKNYPILLTEGVKKGRSKYPRIK